MYYLDWLYGVVLIIYLLTCVLLKEDVVNLLRHINTKSSRKMCFLKKEFKSENENFRRYEDLYLTFFLIKKVVTKKYIVFIFRKIIFFFNANFLFKIY